VLAITMIQGELWMTIAVPIAGHLLAQRIVSSVQR
jgi:hypothetical protein